MLWNSTPEAKALRTRLKGCIKGVHSDFETASSAIVVPAYNLSRDTSRNKAENEALRRTTIESLLLNHIFSDAFVQVGFVLSNVSVTHIFLASGRRRCLHISNPFR